MNVWGDRDVCVSVQQARGTERSGNRRTIFANGQRPTNVLPRPPPPLLVRLRVIQNPPRHRVIKTVVPSSTSGTVYGPSSDEVVGAPVHPVECELWEEMSGGDRAFSRIHNHLLGRRCMEVSFLCFLLPFRFPVINVFPSPPSLPPPSYLLSFPCSKPFQV